jgi:hypothetical protein
MPEYPTAAGMKYYDRFENANRRVYDAKKSASDTAFRMKSTAAFSVVSGGLTALGLGLAVKGPATVLGVALTPLPIINVISIAAFGVGMAWCTWASRPVLDYYDKEIDHAGQHLATVRAEMDAAIAAREKEIA